MLKIRKRQLGCRDAGNNIASISSNNFSEQIALRCFLTGRSVLHLLSIVCLLLLAGTSSAQNTSSINPTESLPVRPRSVPTQKGPVRSATKDRVVPPTAINKSITPQQTVILPPLPQGLIDELKRQDAAEGRAQRVRLGFGRTFDQPLIVSGENSGAWSVAADGSHVYSIQVTSQGALGIRLHLEQVKLPSAAQLLVYDPNDPNPKSTPMTASDAGPEGDIWMPSVMADTVVLECVIPPDKGLSESSFSITGLSHLYRPLVRIQPKAACELDVMCYPEWANEAAGVAEIFFTEGLDTFQCTGSLINDSDPLTFINYFLTAHHCIGSQTSAATIEFHWFYQDLSCDGPLDSGTTTGGGADLVATSGVSDFAFLRLRRDPPDGVYYLGWTTETPSMTDTLTGIHHPVGERKRISFGGLWGILSDFWQVQWNPNGGVTEEGSSGSPLFNGAQLVVGQLYGGSSSCDNPTGIDYYGRFDKTFNAIARWLSPSGSYNGLFAEGGGVAIESSGFINIRLQPSGAFSGAILLAGKRYGFTAVLAADNTATKVINRPGASPLMIDLALDLNVNQFTGTISDGSWTANLTAPHAAFDRRLNPCPWQGSYTFVLPGDTSDHSLPAGNGYGTVKVDASGSLRAVGSLADRIAFTQTVPLSANGDWPLYWSGNAGKEEVWAQMLFDTNRPNDDINGVVTWIKKPIATAKFYAAGFTNQINAIGSFYQKPPNTTTRVLDLPNAIVTFSGGNLATDFADGITIAPNNHVTNESASTNKLTLVFAPATGLFTGSVTPPGLTRSSSYFGAAFQKQNAGFGYMLGTTETSSVVISGP